MLDAGCWMLDENSSRLESWKAGKLEGWEAGDWNAKHKILNAKHSCKKITFSTFYETVNLQYPRFIRVGIIVEAKRIVTECNRMSLSSAAGSSERPAPIFLPSGA
jgi:hypothetical protein